MAIEMLNESASDAAAMAAMQNEAPPPEPAPEPAPAPAPAPEPAPDSPIAKAEPASEPAQPKQQQPRLVPHAALHEERVRRQQLEQRLRELEQKVVPQAQPGDQPPDESTDPIGAINWLKGQLRQQTEQQQRAAQEQAYWADLSSRVQTRVNAYAADHPEYVDQVKYLREFRYRELSEGLGYPPQAAMAQVQREEMELGRMAVEQDLDPGEMVARLASVRGWKAAAAAAAPTQAPAAPPVSLAPQPVALPVAAEQRVERLARGQKAAVSPSTAGGGGPAAEMTLEQLARLDGAAFDQAFKAHGKRLFGG